MPGMWHDLEGIYRKEGVEIGSYWFYFLHGDFDRIMVD
jgi:hypothetical protein